MMMEFKRFGLIVLTILALVSTGICYQTDKVVLVIIDGLRYTEGLGDPTHTCVPEMYALSQQGAIVEPFLNDGFTYTARAVPAIWCGAWTEMISFSDPTCGGQQNSYSELPSIFEYYRRQLSRPESDCVYVMKNLCSWKGSFNSEYGPDYWPLYHCVGSSDLNVWHEAEDILTVDQPSFMLLYLADVDHEGHSGNWGNYTHAISVADSIVGMLWDLLQSSPHYSGTTSVFVTNDHGRHTTDFSGHGDGCEGCRTIQLLALGPDIQEGLVSTTSRTLRDVTPTIGELLGFDAEYSTGTVMTELFRITDIVDDLTIGILGSSNVVLQWSPVTGAVEYNIYRGALPDAVDSLVATTTNGLWMDMGGLDQQQGYYRVTVVR
jgi:hypothetical protein